MIDLSLAERLLDYGARLRDQPARAREQLEGAVALHNLLERQSVAYLADEVGMGKTLVALGAVVLFRHFNPNFRVLILAPKENIQEKWARELQTFISQNVRVRDLRVKTIDGRPARPITLCHSLLELVHEATADPDRDFLLRMTSFSLPLAGRGSVDADAGRRMRDTLRRCLPWLPDDMFDLRSKESFKDQVAQAVCCALPEFDLVIVDEGHNLKHGVGDGVSDRNRVLSRVFGRSRGSGGKQLKGFGPRARRVLFLSATPVEETYRHLWNQLDVFGKADAWDVLRDKEKDEEALREAVARLVVRRVTAMRVGQDELTRNLYRREWRRGGVQVHDEPMRIQDPRQRLVVALVQKKVSELLGDGDRFKRSFQIGMLASFESFLETAKVRRDDDAPVFDDSERVDDPDERLGVDVGDVNLLARSYRRRFNRELPHPKMDALVDVLSRAWTTGRKGLVFVRRVASVGELERKLGERYDQWLLGMLRQELPLAVQPRFEQLIEAYQRDRQDALARRTGRRGSPTESGEQDPGGADTFFAWFFRGEGPPRVVSGANVQQRFVQRGTVYATFFEDNVVAEVLGCQPGEVEANLARAVGVEGEQLRRQLRERAMRFLSRAKVLPKADRFMAFQGAAIEWLEATPGAHQSGARAAWHGQFEFALEKRHASSLPELGDLLELRTFFTELRLRPELREAIWPTPTTPDPAQAFRERTLRALLLAATARLGHAFIDLYTLTIRQLGSLEAGARATQEESDTGAIAAYLDLLEEQRQVPVAQRGWRAFDELAELARCFDLVVDMNVQAVRQAPLPTAAKTFGTLLGRQQPVGGMSGQVNQTLLRQFRMPGYPLVLITTDLLQEGEDLHPFCSDVYHYGISWTPSAMEQRIGRIDRVRSQTDRRLAALAGPLEGEDKLQVFIPHLEDTIEVLQVDRVLQRMDTFVRLMHHGLGTTGQEDRRIHADQAFAAERKRPAPIASRLESAFPVAPELLSGTVTDPAVDEALATALLARFDQLGVSSSSPRVSWESAQIPGVHFGWAEVEGERVELSLLLHTLGGRPLVRGIALVGRVAIEELPGLLRDARVLPVRLAAIETKDDEVIDISLEDETLLHSEDPTHDRDRVEALLNRLLEAFHRLDADADESDEGRVRLRSEGSRGR